jgi:hypothetical protein
MVDYKMPQDAPKSANQPNAGDRPSFFYEYLKNREKNLRWSPAEVKTLFLSARKEKEEENLRWQTKAADILQASPRYKNRPYRSLRIGLDPFGLDRAALHLAEALKEDRAAWINPIKLTVDSQPDGLNSRLAYRQRNKDGTMSGWIEVTASVDADSIVGPDCVVLGESHVRNSILKGKTHIEDSMVIRSSLTDSSLTKTHAWGSWIDSADMVNSRTRLSIIEKTKCESCEFQLAKAYNNTLLKSSYLQHATIIEETAEHGTRMTHNPGRTSFFGKVQTAIVDELYRHEMPVRLPYSSIPELESFCRPPIVRNADVASHPSRASSSTPSTQYPSNMTSTQNQVHIYNKYKEFSGPIPLAPNNNSGVFRS